MIWFIPMETQAVCFSMGAKHVSYEMARIFYVSKQKSKQTSVLTNQLQGNFKTHSSKMVCQSITLVSSHRLGWSIWKFMICLRCYKQEVEPELEVVFHFRLISHLMLLSASRFLHFNSDLISSMSFHYANSNSIWGTLIGRVIELVHYTSFIAQ